MKQIFIHIIRIGRDRRYWFTLYTVKGDIDGYPRIEWIFSPKTVQNMTWSERDQLWIWKADAGDEDPQGTLAGLMHSAYGPTTRIRFIYREAN